MMPTATVTVAEKAAPAAGKKRGRVKDTAGVIYQADPITLNEINLGATYEFTYRDDEWKGLKFRVIEMVGPIAPGGVTHVPRQASTYTPAPSYPPSQQGPDYKSEEIACLAIIKCVSPLSVDAVEIAHALKTAAMGLRQFRKWQREKNIETGPQRRPEEEFNDSIPDF